MFKEQAEKAKGIASMEERHSRKRVAGQESVGTERNIFFPWSSVYMLLTLSNTILLVLGGARTSWIEKENAPTRTHFVKNFFGTLVMCG